MFHPGSPFQCDVVDSSKVAISGEGLEKVPIGRRATFIIEPEGRLGQPEVKILGPTKKTVHSSIQIPSENKFLVEYVPVDVGKCIVFLVGHCVYSIRSCCLVTAHIFEYR